ncbi:histidine kinase [Actinomadura madurae]|nr:histidine kinase dimerization/phosphoacceptor domain-containing protein [Actinomadura madurae]MCQ0003363.1 histidine kinase [Actinomadura madurae]
MDESELRSPVFKRLSRRGLIGLDAGAAILYLLVMLTLPAGGCGSMLMAAVLIPAAGLPLALRRLWPVPVFAVTLAASTAMLVVDLPWDSYAAAAYALYPVALTRRRRRWVPTSLIGVASGLFILGGAMVGPAGRHAEIAGKVLLGLAVLGASWTLGRVVRERRAQAARSARRLADQAVSDERLRIARELHDVVAHSMSLIAVKAGVAVHVAEARPEEALDALRVIEATSRSSLAEMRHLLGVLRTGAADAELTPSPGLADLSGLADRAAMAASMSTWTSTPATSPTASPSPPTASCRRRSPTSSSTPRPPAAASASRPTASGCASTSPTTGPASASCRAGTGTASSACASAS